jgi:hypothetical protein
MLTIENMFTLINQRIDSGMGIYYVLNTWSWNQEGNEQYHIHLRHINKTYSDIKIVLNRFKTDNGYIIWNEDTPINSMLLKVEQISNKQTFIRAVEMIMK